MNQTVIYICNKDISDFQLKNYDVSITQGVCHVIHVFFWILFK